MEFIGDILNFLVRPLAKVTKAALPQRLAKNFEPDSNLGDFIGFCILVVFLASLVLAVRCLYLC